MNGHTEQFMCVHVFSTFPTISNNKKFFFGSAKRCSHLGFIVISNTTERNIRIELIVDKLTPINNFWKRLKLENSQNIVKMSADQVRKVEKFQIKIGFFFRQIIDFCINEIANGNFEKWWWLTFSCYGQYFAIFAMFSLHLHNLIVCDLK